MTSSYLKERAEAARFMRRLYQRKLTTALGGNVSLRTDDDLVAITPSGIDKGRITPPQIALVSLDGNNLTPELRPSIETSMHLQIYRNRKDVRAVVHSHPVTATAFACAAASIETDLAVETYALIPKVAFARYAESGSAALARAVSEQALSADVILLENHGVIAVGATLLLAFERLELVESAAQMTLVTRQLEGAHPLQSDWKKGLDRLVGRAPSH